MNKLVFTFLILSLSIFSVFAADLNTDKKNYNIGETIQITITDCQSSIATANIPNLWADQGAPTSNSWETSFLVPKSINTGSLITINGYCDSTLSTQICINPNCPSESKSSGRKSSGGKSSGGKSSKVESVVEDPSVEEPVVEENLSEAYDYNNYDDNNNFNVISLIIAIIILIIISIFGVHHYRKKKRKQTYYYQRFE
tara:strand:+ start:697 stop:1293 length:597 start_codon:yes stop_codon:yes gene_type:complete